jgi:hypothetical protein
MSRFATLVQAINRISAMPAINISEALATGPVRASRRDLIFGRGLEGSRRPERRKTIYVGLESRRAPAAT